VIKKNDVLWDVTTCIVLETLFEGTFKRLKNKPRKQQARRMRRKQSGLLGARLFVCLLFDPEDAGCIFI
jgi:hypothetical protein